MTVCAQYKVSRLWTHARRNSAPPRVLLALAVAFVAPAAKAGITFTNVFSFDGTNGGDPVGTLVQGRDGNLYGVMQEGGPYTYDGGFSAGGLFRIGLDGTYTNLA